MKKARELCIISISGVIMYAAQVVLAPIANVELVSILVIVFTLYFRKKVIGSIAVFVLLEGLHYGFGMWWIAYLYIWYVLAALTYLFKNINNLFFWAVLAGLYGLIFGTLTAIPYIFINGLAFAIAYTIAGIPFDTIHAVGNALLTLILFKPLSIAMNRLEPFISHW